MGSSAFDGSCRRISIFYANISMWSKDAEDYLAQEASHIVTVAEHRLDEPMFRSTLSKLTFWKRQHYVAYAQRTGLSKWATSGGVAILPRRHLYSKALDDDFVEYCCDGATASAAALRWKGCILRLKSVSILHIVVYLKTNEELSEFNSSVLQQVFLAVANFSGPSVVVGDWQMEPSTLASSPWISKLGLRILVPQGASFSCKAGPGRLIDFCVVSNQIYDFLDAFLDFAVPWTPHAALRISMPYRPRSCMVPKLRLPRPLPALPLNDDKLHTFDPDLWAVSRNIALEYVDKWSRNTGIIGATPEMLRGVPEKQVEISANLCLHATTVEIYAVKSAGVQNHATRQYLGRGGLPHVALSPMINRNVLESHYSSPGVQFWSKVHTLLRWLLPGTRGHRRIGDLHKPILQLNDLLKQAQTHWRRDARPNAPVSAWAGWSEQLTPTAVMSASVGYNAERIQTWVDRAAAQRKKATAIDTSKRKSLFKKWIEDDLKNGAAASHALVKDNATTIFTAPEDAPSTFATWANLWNDSGFAGNPFSVESSANDVPWSGQLERLVQAACVGSNLGILNEAKSIAAKAEIMEDINVKSVRDAATHYPDKKAKGVDSWSTAFLRVLPDEMLQGFADSLNASQLNLVWPIQLLLNLVSLLPKQQGGERPIAKTPILYRLWNVIRAGGVKCWSNNVVGDFDFAASGRSALFSGASRCLANELATLSGQQVASLLWDLAKFFDTIPPEEVVRKGLDLGYPPIDLVMAVSMHIAPRMMVLSGVASAIIVPLCSILAGCMHSVNFARMVMFDPISAIVRREPRVQTSTFVDDVSQISMGTLHKVADGLVHAGVLFANGMKKLRLRISDKSVVVSSSHKLAVAIANALWKHCRISLRVEAAGRDLGVLNNPSSRRRTVVQAKRVAKATKKARRISNLARSVRRASILAHTGALPQASWGSAVLGFAPTVMRNFRAAMASASGIVARGRCPSTAIAITMGPSKDPAVSIPMDQVALWVDLWRGDASLRTLAARYWRTAWKRVTATTTTAAVDAITAGRSQLLERSQEAPELQLLQCDAVRAQWNNVLGPLTATMAVLYDQGWNLENPTKWVDPSGQGWHPDFNADKAPFIQLVGSFAVKKVWQRASLGWNAKGVENGVDWTATLALYKHIATAHASYDNEDYQFAQESSMEGQSECWPPTSAAWLELLMTGGYWPQQRVADIHSHATPMCPRCGQHPETALHLLWECSANQDIDDQRVTDTQALVHQSRNGAAQYPCLWLRGLLPSSAVVVNTPFLENEQLFYVARDSEGSWPGGIYHSDASGGVNSSIPVIRRCGVGVAFVAQDDNAYVHGIKAEHFLWGVYAALTGKVHTIVRAELYAMVVIARHVEDNATVTIVSDSKVNVDHFHLGRQHCATASHSDLWYEFWQLIGEKGLAMDMQWTKSHVTPELLVRYNISSRHLFGNICADKLADMGASQAQVWDQDAYNVKWHYSLVRRIQSRAIVVMQSALQRTSTLQKPPKQPKLVKPSSASLIFSTQHDFVVLTRTLHCNKCLKHSGASEDSRVKFLMSPCIPNLTMVRNITLGNARPIAIRNKGDIQVGRSLLHQSHDLFVFKGLYYCGKCGYCASAKAQKLLGECTERGEAAAKRVLALKRDKLPSGLLSWPSEQASALHVVETCSYQTGEGA